MSAKFRFQDLEIWQEAILMVTELFKIARELEEVKLFRFADQLRGSGMGIPNNIAESTGTNMVKEQQQLLRYAKRECFEAANMLVILVNESLVGNDVKEILFDRLDILSRRIQAYSNSLNK
ncbi:MAG: four helix bundle protein [Saprospiraceae bacterium]|nr:four helix bundle protein [Saprospiraceae bacterium]